jgi:hypothetical protein
MPPYKPGTAGMRDLPPFSNIKASIAVLPTRSGFRVYMSRDELFDVVRKLLIAVPVDDAWYKLRYPGVADAIASGDFPSASAHFIQHGYFEDRMPFRMEVHEDEYLNSYPHVRELIDAGEMQSAADHFMKIGYSQGCLPGRL